MYEVPPVAVSVVDPPEHIAPFAGEIFPVGADAIVTDDVFEAGPSQLP